MSIVTRSTSWPPERGAGAREERLRVRQSAGEALSPLGPLSPGQVQERGIAGKRLIPTEVQLDFDKIVSAFEALAEALDTADFGLAARFGGVA